jgi:8-oxo-dGTP diphosphatase
MIRVVAGIIYNAEREVLIAKRPLDKHLGGLWEFPGGKLEAKESTLEALRRELKEEVNIELISAKPLTEINVSYPDKQVLLYVWKVEQHQGTAEGLEGQEIRWVNPQDFHNYRFPEVNQQLFKFI